MVIARSARCSSMRAFLTAWACCTVFTVRKACLYANGPDRRSKAQVTRPQHKPASRPDQAWSLDFVADQLSNGNRFRCLTIVDAFTRECLAIEVGQRLSGTDVVTVLNRIRQSGRLPGVLFCDNRSEFTGQILDLRAYRNKVKIEFSRAGKPTDSAFIESFNGTFSG